MTYALATLPFELPPLLSAFILSFIHFRFVVFSSSRSHQFTSSFTYCHLFWNLHTPYNQFLWRVLFHSTLCFDKYFVEFFCLSYTSYCQLQIPLEWYPCFGYVNSIAIIPAAVTVTNSVNLDPQNYTETYQSVNSLFISEALISHLKMLLIVVLERVKSNNIYDVMRLEMRGVTVQ